jgi:hypothetical protein
LYIFEIVVKPFVNEVDVLFKKQTNNTIDDEKSLKLSQFIETTNTNDTNQARKILESTNWHLGQAVEKYFRNKYETNKTKGNYISIKSR